MALHEHRECPRFLLAQGERPGGRRMFGKRMEPGPIILLNKQTCTTRQIPYYINIYDYTSMQDHGNMDY